MSRAVRAAVGQESRTQGTLALTLSRHRIFQACAFACACRGVSKTNLDLSELVAKQDVGDVLRAVAEAGLQLIMEAGVESLIGSGNGTLDTDARREVFAGLCLGANAPNCRRVLSHPVCPREDALLVHIEGDMTELLDPSSVPAEIRGANLAHMPSVRRAFAHAIPERRAPRSAHSHACAPLRR